MKDLKCDKQKESILKAFLNIDANILVNLYTNENVIFGRIKANDKVPIDQYLKDLGFCNIEKFIDDLFLNGHNIENGYVIERDFNDRCFELFRDKINCIFDRVPKDKSDETDNDDIFRYKFGLYGYIKSIYPLFKEIIETEISPDYFATVPDTLDKNTKRAYYANVIKFVLAIKLKWLRKGSRIDRYVKKLPLIPPLIMRLIKKYKGHFYLNNNDTNSLDYKLALFSCFRFFNEENAKLFELKALRWEELNNQIQ